MKRLLCVAAASLLAGSLTAQEPDNPHAVQPERPTVATHAGTVAPGWLEIEAGVEHDRFYAAQTQTFTPAVFKIGLASHVQLGISASAVHNDRATGVGDAAVGLKWRLVDDAPLLGDFAVLPSLKFPTGSLATGTGTGTTDASLLLISSHDLGGVSMDLNAGLTRHGAASHATAFTSGLWTASFGGPARGKLGWTAECYGYPGTGAGRQAPIVALLGGPTLLAKQWLAFDAGVIEPVAGPQPRAVYAGGVYNVGRLWR